MARRAVVDGGEHHLHFEAEDVAAERVGHAVDVFAAGVAAFADGFEAEQGGLPDHFVRGGIGRVVEGDTAAGGVALGLPDDAFGVEAGQHRPGGRGDAVGTDSFRGAERGGVKGAARIDDADEFAQAGRGGGLAAEGGAVEVGIDAGQHRQAQIAAAFERDRTGIGLGGEPADENKRCEEAHAVTLHASPPSCQVPKAG